MSLRFSPQEILFHVDGVPLTLSSEQESELRKLPWWHEIPFTKAYTTDGKTSLAGNHPNIFRAPADIAGRSVLIIGLRDGLLGFMAEAYGAASIVGIDDDYSSHIYQESFLAAKKTLRSAVERAAFSVEDLLNGKAPSFDVVIVGDLLVYHESPGALLRAASSCATKQLILVSPCDTNPGESPKLQMLPAYHPAQHADYLPKYYANLSFLHHVLREEGWEARGGAIFDTKDRICLIATPQPLHAPFPYELLPIDPATRARTAIVVLSCHKFRQVWAPFFTLFRRYWPDCPYPVFLGTDRGNHPGVRCIEVGEDRGWTNNAHVVLSQVPAERIILFQEDFLLEAPVDNERVEKLVTHSFQCGVGCLRLMPCPGPTASWFATDHLGVIKPTDPYRLSMQLSIWKRDTLYQLFPPNLNPWQVEVQNQLAARLCPDPFLSVRSETAPPIPYFATAIIAGEWADGALALLKREGIATEHLTKRLRDHPLQF